MGWIHATPARELIKILYLQELVQESLQIQDKWIILKSDFQFIFRAETFSTWWSLVILGYVLLLLLLVHVMDQRLPAPLTVKDAAVKPEAFIEERARQYLKQLTSVGPRPAGKIHRNKK